jgi:hypothetical protein
MRRPVEAWVSMRRSRTRPSTSARTRPLAPPLPDHHRLAGRADRRPDAASPTGAMPSRLPRLAKWFSHVTCIRWGRAAPLRNVITARFALPILVAASCEWPFTAARGRLRGAKWTQSGPAIPANADGYFVAAALAGSRDADPAPAEARAFPQSRRNVPPDIWSSARPGNYPNTTHFPRTIRCNRIRGQS